MTTDTLTLPRRALVEGDGVDTAPRPQPPIDGGRRSSAVPRRRRRGASRLLRLLISGDGRGSTADPLQLLGPSGGSIWTSSRI